MKDFFKKLIKRKKDELEKLKKKALESADVDEVRALGETMTSLRDEINEAEQKLAELEEQETKKDDEEDTEEEGRDGGIPKDAVLRGLNPVKAYREQNTEDLEQRKAFMEFACRNQPIPKEMRANATTTTTDAGAVIPKTIVNEIIQKVESYGNLYSQVRKLDVQGGVEIPISDLKPTAKWITETTTSDDQKLQAKTSVSFSYYGLECKIAQSLLTKVTTLEIFEKLFIELATEAIIKALEIGIIKGTGSGQMLGVTNDSRVPTDNVIELTESDFTWKNLKKKVFAKMKKSYRNGSFIMAQETFDGYLDGMTDTNGQPIGRVNYGIDGDEKYRFGGKVVETVEDDVITSFDTASAGDVIGVFMKLKDYGINSNMEMTLNHWVDHDTNKTKDQLILICDGKLLDPNGVLILKKKATASA